MAAGCSCAQAASVRIELHVVSRMERVCSAVLAKLATHKHTKMQRKETNHKIGKIGSCLWHLSQSRGLSCDLRIEWSLSDPVLFSFGWQLKRSFLKTELLIVGFLKIGSCVALEIFQAFFPLCCLFLFSFSPLSHSTLSGLSLLLDVCLSLLVRLSDAFSLCLCFWLSGLLHSHILSVCLFLSLTVPLFLSLPISLTHTNCLLCFSVFFSLSWN